MRILRAPAVLSAATVAALLLAGCGGSGDDAGTTAEADPSAEQESPLSEYLSAVWGGDLSPEEQTRKFDEQQQRQEELVAQCMQEEGFEYAPNTASADFSAGEEDVWEPDDREWVTQYGYGAVRSPGSEGPMEGSEEEYVDPNADYLASLSESEQTAFNEALYGPMPTEEEMAEQEAAAEDGSVEMEYDWTTAGCHGQAQHEVSGEDLTQSDEFRPLFDAMNALYEDAGSRPEMVALEAEWVACMDAAGHPGFTEQVEAQDSIFTQLNELWESGMPVGDGAEAGAEEGTEAPFTGGPDEAALDALAEEEVTLALADLGCREETDYRDRQGDSMRTVEEQFIADHQAELDALVAASEQD